MVRFAPIILIASVSSIASVGQATAQVVPGWNTKQFSLERIDADRVRLMREVEIEGEPGTANAGQKFFADDLQIGFGFEQLSNAATDRVVIVNNDDPSDRARHNIGSPLV